MDLFSDDSDNEMYEAGVFDSKLRIPSFELDYSRVNLRTNYCTELAESEFVYRFRLDKTRVNELLLNITPVLKVTSSRNFGISPLHQLLLTLRFYALGRMLVSAADYVGVSVSSASRIVKDVSRAIAGLYSQYVKVLDDTEPGFYNIAGFPRVLGAIDCTHIPIQSPNSNTGEEFRNRKGTYSINVQGVCNAELIFMNVVARWPGSTHDATIFNNSLLKAQCESGMYGSRWLIGDSAYPCTSYLLTPILNPSWPNEHRYNDAHALTRNPIKRCFDIWKRRFPVLCFKIRVASDTTQALIIATAVLHNICMLNKVVDVDPEVELPSETDSLDFEAANTDSVSIQDYSERHNLVYNYFNI